MPKKGEHGEPYHFAEDSPPVMILNGDGRRVAWVLDTHFGQRAIKCMNDMDGRDPAKIEPLLEAVRQHIKNCPFCDGDGVASVHTTAIARLEMGPDGEPVPVVTTEECEPLPCQHCGPPRDKLAEFEGEEHEDEH